MARKKAGDRVEVDDYRHEDATRMNNPPVGLAHHDTDTPPVRDFAHDPHLDPELSWTGKAERQGFEVEAPSIHVHERMSAEAIVTSAQRRSDTERDQMSLFADERIDHTKTLDFYQHELDWENRFILGDSLVVMTSLLERERLGERVQCIYIDPPYGVNFNSNFQARISNRTPKETQDATLTREPEQIQAYRDTWELGIHSYLTYLRDRLLVARELLAETGSAFVQIGSENTHRVRVLLDEVFGADNHVATITAQKTSSSTARLLATVTDDLLWYAKDASQVTYRPLYRQRDERSVDPQLEPYNRIEMPDGTRRRMTPDERANPELLPDGARRYQLSPLTSQGFRQNTTVDFEYDGKTYHPGANQNWKTTVEGLERLAELRRLEPAGNTLRYVRFVEDGLGIEYTNVWTDTVRAGFGEKKRYVVETNPKIVARAILMASDPGDLVLDPTCGSGTTAYVCEQYGRRWITADTSRVAIALARERLLTAKYPYYQLLDEGRGVDGGLAYNTKARITLGSLAKDEHPEEVAYYDDPKVDRAKVRVSGPFTYEALSRYSINPAELAAERAETATNRAAAADHVTQLLEALQAQGIPRPDGKKLAITALERIAGTGPLHAEGTYETDGEQKRFAVALGPRFGTITPTQVDDALREAYGYDLVVFAGFAAHAETQALLEKGRLGRYDVALLMANPDLLLGSLLKKTTASQTFRLYASPDVTLRKANKMWAVAVNGVDAYDAATGKVTSASQANVRAWFLDTDYDGMVFRIDQAFFPHATSWDALAKALKGTVDEGALDDLAGFDSIPFDAGDQKRCAVRVLTDDGNAAEVILPLNGARS